MEIKIEDGDMQEQWEMWWDCPSCGYGLISHDASYCAGCGRGISWVEKDEQDDNDK